MTSFGVAGGLRRHVNRLEGATGAGHELLDFELRLAEELCAALVERDASLVERDRALERLAARLELRHHLLKGRQRVVERQLIDRSLGGAVEAVSLVGHR